MKIGSLIEWIPQYFKNRDTYKDSNDKGVLERFLDICGDYFDSHIIPDIQGLLDLIDIDTTDEIFLNYIWEFLGQIPYSYGCMVDAKKFELYRKPYSTNYEGIWKTYASEVPKADSRRLLKYAISLFKIRGTNEFYNILMRFYGFNCVVIDPTDTSESVTDIIKCYYDQDEYDGEFVKYDLSTDCYNCTTVQLRLYISDTTITTISDEAKNAICYLLNSFRPINVTEFEVGTNLTFWKYIIESTGLVVTANTEGAILVQA